MFFFIFFRAPDRDQAGHCQRAGLRLAAAARTDASCLAVCIYRWRVCTSCCLCIHPSSHSLTRSLTYTHILTWRLFVVCVCRWRVRTSCCLCIHPSIHPSIHPCIESLTPAYILAFVCRMCVQVVHAHQLLSVLRAVAALRADEEFQEDAADPTVREALADMGRHGNMDK
jgi:hypothetical protein